MKYNFKLATLEWSAPPVDDVGYVNSTTVLRYTRKQVRQFVRRFESVRYDPTGCRNFANKWRDSLGLDSTFGKHVLDFGCGFGIEALQFCRKNNTVSIADICVDNLRAAEYVLRVSGYEPNQRILVDGQYPFFESAKCDVFYANGVLHHTPMARQILERAREILSDQGEVRLMLYSDRAWTIRTGSKLPGVSEEISKHPKFRTFVRGMDAIGQYADWYNKEKVELLSHGLFRLKLFEYLCPNETYCAVVLEKE